MKRTGELFRILLRGLVLVPAVVTLGMILHYGVDGAFNDQWDGVAPLLIKAHNHQLTWADLWKQHNEHRIVVSRLIMIGLARLTDWNIKAELLTIWALACLIAYGVYRISRTTAWRTPWGGLFSFFLASLLIFSPVQYENWLWGMQIQFFVPYACMVGCLAIGCSRLRLGWKVGWCAALATMSTYSSAQGMLCWVLAAPLLFLPRDRMDWRGKRRGLVVWLGGFAACAITYFWGYVKPPSHPPLTDVLTHPLAAMQYMAMYQGMPFASNTPLGLWPLATLAGGLLLALFMGVLAYVIWRRKDSDLLWRCLPWLLLGCFAIANGMMTATGRLGFGVVEALSSRYSTLSLGLPISLVYLLPIVLGDASPRLSTANGRAIAFSCLSAGCVLLLVLHLFSSLQSRGSWRDWHMRALHGKAGILFYNIFQDECLDYCVCPLHPQDLRPVVDPINRMGYIRPPLLTSACMQAIQQPNTAAPGAWGAIQRFGQVSKDEAFVGGWACVPDLGTPADAIVLAYDDPAGNSVAFAIARMGQPREGEVPPDDPLYRAGWRRLFPVNLLPPGLNRISAWAFDTQTARAIRLDGVATIRRDPENGP